MLYMEVAQTVLILITTVIVVMDKLVPWFRKETPNDGFFEVEKKLPTKGGGYITLRKSENDLLNEYSSENSRIEKELELALAENNTLKKKFSRLSFNVKFIVFASIIMGLFFGSRANKK